MNCLFSATYHVASALPGDPVLMLTLTVNPVRRIATGRAMLTINKFETIQFSVSGLYMSLGGDADPRALMLHASGPGSQLPAGRTFSLLLLLQEGAAQWGMATFSLTAGNAGHAPIMVARAVATLERQNATA